MPHVARIVQMDCLGDHALEDGLGIGVSRFGELPGPRGYHLARVAPGEDGTRPAGLGARQIAGQPIDEGVTLRAEHLGIEG
jgi:hypothetical protein